jgi:hypothetical protein
MSIPDEGRRLIETKLDLALKTDSGVQAEKHFADVEAMLSYAALVGHLGPREFSEWVRLVDLNRKRRNYR